MIGRRKQINELEKFLTLITLYNSFYHLQSFTPHSNQFFTFSYRNSLSFFCPQNSLITLSFLLTPSYRLRYHSLLFFFMIISINLIIFYCHSQTHASFNANPLIILSFHSHHSFTLSTFRFSLVFLPYSTFLFHHFYTGLFH